MMLKNLGMLLKITLFMLQNLLWMLCNDESLYSIFETIHLLPVLYIYMHIFKVFESERKMLMQNHVLRIFYSETLFSFFVQI